MPDCDNNCSSCDVENCESRQGIQKESRRVPRPCGRRVHGHPRRGDRTAQYARSACDLLRAGRGQSARTPCAGDCALRRVREGENHGRDQNAIQFHI